MGASRSLVISGGNVLLADGTIAACDVLTEGGIITKIGADLAGDETIDARGSYVLPGLVDIHNHGIGFESVGEGDLKRYAQLEASRGATTFFPTFFAPAEEIEQQLRRHLAETDDLRETPNVGGFRLESPYLADASGGLPKDTAQITPATTNMLLEAGKGRIKIWDVSPEMAGATGLIRELSAKGIICSMAHTTATIEQAAAAVDAGARLVTHLFDTFEMPVETDIGVYPAGLTDYLLVEDRVACEIIGDGTHVHPLLVEKTIRCKTAANTVFVTDSMLGAGLPLGEYVLPSGWGNAVVDGSNNGVRLVDRDMELMGSALTPIDGFRNAVRLFGKDIATASRLCSGTPARLLGLNKGELAIGRDADVIVLSLELDLKHVVCGGQELSTQADWSTR